MYTSTAMGALPPRLKKKREEGAPPRRPPTEDERRVFTAAGTCIQMGLTIGTLEHHRCLLRVKDLLEQGKTKAQARQYVEEYGLEPGAGETNWLLWGGIGAVALVGGALLLSRKRR